MKPDVAARLSNASAVRRLAEVKHWVCSVMNDGWHPRAFV